MKRFKHSLSHYKLLTCDFGQLVPIGLLEALPGDTFRQSTSMLIRMSPLLAPVMHPVTVRIHHWFVPNRVLWDDWEDFITGGPDGTGAGTSYPTLGSEVVAEKDLLDYLGIKPGTTVAAAISALPVRAYNMIFNQFYRDQDLVTARDEDDLTLPAVGWEKDYFTTSRPWAQKGPQVTIPLGVSAPIYGVDQNTEIGISGGALNSRMQIVDPSSNVIRAAAPGATGDLRFSTDSSKIGLEADLSAATAADIITIRQAFALQRYQEARAQYGSRYTEYLRYLGINPQDARLQRPEYLGGGKQTVAFSEVLRTGNVDADTSVVGEMKGHGIAAMRSNRYQYFVQEHGYIMTLMSVRPRSIYQDALDRTWSRRTKEDYYQRELEMIGQQEVYKREIYLKHDAADADVFGYQNRYADYRHQYSSVAGEFRSTLNHWHLARAFADHPTLNGSFVTCSPSKRVFADQTSNTCWVMASHSVQARRLVGKQTIGRVV